MMKNRTAQIVLQTAYCAIGIIGIIVVYIIFIYLTYNPLSNYLFYDMKEEKYGIDIYK